MFFTPISKLQLVEQQICSHFVVQHVERYRIVSMGLLLGGLWQN